MTIDNKLYTKAELEQQGYTELIGSRFAGYDIFYKGNLRIDRERFMFGKIKGDNGQEPKYKLIIKYKV